MGRSERRSEAALTPPTDTPSMISKHFNGASVKKTTIEDIKLKTLISAHGEITGLAVKIIKEQTEPGAAAPELPLRAL